MFRTFRPRGCVYFSALGKPGRKMKASRRRRIRSRREEDCPSPLDQVWLDASEVGLRFAGKDTRQYPGPHKRKSSFRSKGESRCRTALSKHDRRFTLLALSQGKTHLKLSRVIRESKGNYEQMRIGIGSFRNDFEIILISLYPSGIRLMDISFRNQSFPTLPLGSS